LGDQELELLRYVAEHSPASVRDVLDGYGAPRGLARTTVLTVMERLRRKGYLTRSSHAGVYKYSPKVSSTEVMRSVIRRFVEKTLGGSVSPMVAYLAQESQLSDEDVEELMRVVEELKSRRSEGPR
jgi:predicted transcriptional regulator